MHHARTTKRTLFQRGPLVALTIVFFLLIASTVSAHDPGLSALDVSVSRGTMVVSLSMARTDAALVVPTHDANAGKRLISLTREAIRVSIDGERLASINEEASIDAAGARVRMTFAVRNSRDRAARLI